MSPKPQQKTLVQPESLGDADAGNRVVITGMAGSFPDSYNVKQLEERLYNKVNPVGTKEPRWEYYHPEIVNYTGQVPDLNRFDAQFFKVHYLLANAMDPMSRKMLEHAYEAIYDAGICPEELSGKKVGCYIGTCMSESEKTLNYSVRGLGIAGCSKAMFANRISYWLNAKGPSMSVDQACCRSSVALQLAYEAIRRGDCEAAIVGGANLCLHPQQSIHNSRVINLCPDGKTKSFDKNADGCAQSEFISVFFIQKAKNANRIYAEVVHVKNEYTEILKTETGPKYGFYRDVNNMTDFIKQFYKEANVDPEDVKYVEAVGSATDEEDKVELEAFNNVYCTQRREEPLLVGSVTSNIGYTAAASGICSIVKVLLAYRNGLLAGNLHCENIRDDIDALRDKRIQIVTDHQKFNGGYVAVNGISITGINAHILLQRVHKAKDLSRYQSSIPRLVTISARQQSAVDSIFKDLKSRPIDPEELALFYNIHEHHISGHLGRGYTILDTNEDQETVCLVQNSDYFDDARKPLWFVYSGMGSQWVGMGAHLMRIPTFAAAIERCDKVLKPKGIDIVDIITSQDKSMFDNILHSFVGIAAIQIGLTDILTAVGFVPDKIIGHSVGELGCAYADGCFTAEEMIMSAYSRGLVSVQTPFIRGSMAAVGVGYEEVSKMCPPEIEVACHNSADSSTISGPADEMRAFVSKLTAEGIFAKEVPSSNIAYHSRYIAEAGPGLLKYLKEVIKKPKARSDKWVSTSVPEEKWNTEAAKYSSAEYHTNNLLNPVLFEETSRLIPRDAICVEIAPHGLLQAILKRSLPDSCKNIPLTRRGHSDNALHVLEAIGKLYMEGYNPKIKALYPKVEFPVSVGTPMLGHLVEWSHAESWLVPLYKSANRQTLASYRSIISLFDDEHKYLSGHVIQGKTVFPYSAILVSVWDTLAMLSGDDRRSTSVEFTNVHLLAQPIMHYQKQLKLLTSFHRGNGQFEVTHEGTQVAIGFISGYQDDKDRAFSRHSEETSTRILNSNDIYELLYIKGCSYKNEFRSILCANTSITEAEIQWKNNWVTFLDAMLQLQIVKRKNEAIAFPNFIRRILIDVNKQAEFKTESIVANVFDNSHLIRCGGVLMESFKFQNVTFSPYREVSLLGLKNPDHTLTAENLKVVRESAPNLREAMLSCGQIGNLESLQWVEQPELTETGIDIKVSYSGLNNMDLQRITGTVPFKNEIAFGMDISGHTINGTRVMGLVPQRALSTRVRVDKNLLWPVPELWTLEDAATVPLAYCLAYYCLAIKASLQPGDSVLVHCGSGALGQAVITIALAYKCEVFTTVSDTKKKQFIQELFPSIDDDHIANSRDKSFKDKILTVTQGKGCRVVICGVQGWLRNCSLSVTGASGVCIDTALLQMQENFDYGMNSMTLNRSYVPINLDTIFNVNGRENKTLIQSLLSEGIAKGIVRPLTRVTYAPIDVTRAFKLLLVAQNRGKVLIDMQNTISVQKLRLQLSEDYCHAIITDTNILGMQLAERLANRGANKLLIVTSDLGNSIRYKVELGRENGLQIELKVVDNYNEAAIVNALQSSGNLGAIQTAYTVVSKANVGLGLLLDRLQGLVKISCPSLRNLAVIEVNDAGRKQSPLVPEEGFKFITLPTIYLPNIKDSTDGNVDIATAIEGIEQALLTHEATVVVQYRTKPISVLEGLQIIIGIDISKDVSIDVPLTDIVKESIKLRSIQNYLRDTCNMSYSDVQMENLTIQNILDMESLKVEHAYKETTGIDTFFSCVDPDELLSTTEMVFPPTLVAGTSMRDDEFDVTQTFLCVVPGVEGHHGRFRLLCERLKLPVLLLQPSVNRHYETFSEMAQRFTEILLKKTKLNNNFYLLGYESGVMVALEMAAILEQRGLTGTIFCLGGSPHEISAEFKTKLGHLTEKSLQDTVIKHMVSLGADSNVDVEPILNKASTWQEKVVFTIRELTGRVPYSGQYAKDLIETAYARICTVLNYKIKPLKLRSRIILLRAQLNTIDSSIQDYSSEPVLVYQLKVPLAHSSQDLRCSGIINSHLDKELLDAFEKKNLCETFLLNADKFMATSCE
ncbi:fatty acid synthase-like isoform X1 [Leptidea sinapis]|uniref:fatty acid synthase-like isoform X1 n=3 Tax=Leptidea sinapis TaxID=189913 RepID=UPI0021429754|nr:fatty acid synthase-like isoform X1 [Leptidea sinapis]